LNIKAGNTDSSKLRIEGLDLLRLFAALSVVLFHFVFRGAAADNLCRVSIPALAPFFKYGYLGVDCFFVISGFVIAWSAKGRSWQQFSVARFARIYPAFIICMTATFVLTFLLGAPRYQTSTVQWTANLLVVSPAVGVNFMDSAYWSIVYELVFYGWMALLIATKAFPRHSRLVLIFWLGMSMMNELAVGPMVVQKLFLTDHSGFFAAGILLYLLRKGERDGLTWMLLGLSALVAIYQVNIGAEWLREHYRTYFSATVLTFIALGSIGIVAAAMCVRDLKFRPGVVAAIGGLTYPLYLLHQKVGYILFNRFDGLLSAPVLVALTTAFMFFASWGVWKFAEPPIRSLIYRWFGRTSKVAALQPS
jgi:peptidoglycan/LPS O-acetylase OafA/YrhL